MKARGGNGDIPRKKGKSGIAEIRLIGGRRQNWLKDRKWSYEMGKMVIYLRKGWCRWN